MTDSLERDKQVMGMDKKILCVKSTAIAMWLIGLLITSVSAFGSYDTAFCMLFILLYCIFTVPFLFCTLKILGEWKARRVKIYQTNSSKVTPEEGSEVQGKPKIDRIKDSKRTPCKQEPYSNASYSPNPNSNLTPTPASPSSLILICTIYVDEKKIKRAGV
jgi:hypothetical protein